MVKLFTLVFFLSSFKLPSKNSLVDFVLNYPVLLTEFILAQCSSNPLCFVFSDCSINISELRDGQRHDMWIPLENIKMGRLHLAITVLEDSGKVFVPVKTISGVGISV